MSDEEILRSAYGKYAGNDGNRWTEANQLGDALRALKNNEFTYISPDGTTTTEETKEESSVVVETPKEEEKKELYRVGTEWENGKCVNQHGAFTSLDNAKKDSDSAMNEKKVSYYVFDESGKTIHSSIYKAPEMYRVGTEWKNNTCQNQHGAFTSLDNAKKDCDDAKDSIKKTYHVFDSEGVIVYTSEYKAPVKTNILYKVGIAWENGKCINQKGAFSNLSYAKSSATGARNTFKKSHYVFDNEGNIIFAAEYSDPKDNFYRVGTAWSRGICINQKGAFSVATNARNLANSLTKKTGTIYFVFDPTGKVIYTGSKK